MRLTTLCIVGLLTGCTYHENLPEKDLTGKVRIPKDALLALHLIDEDGGIILENGLATDADGGFTIDVTNEDALIGPVYLGAFPEVGEDDFDFPHPIMGPILDADRPGDTYPYGGTTVGRFDYACYEQLSCKVVTGRHTAFQDIIDFFQDVTDDPILGDDGAPVESGQTYREHCYETEYVTSNTELSFIDEDPDEDVSPNFKPYFKDKGEYFEADVTIPHTLFVEGMALWGWVDMPSPAFKFASCDESAGDYFYRYSEQFYQGSNFPDVLNFPGIYIDAGDWISEPIILNSEDEDFVIELNIQYEG